MKSQISATNYWFIIEPFVYVGITNQYVLLYNTLDGTTIESDKNEVISLLQKMLRKENNGVINLTNASYQNKDINGFIRELREKYMGDIIDMALSNAKPVQLLPYFNYLDRQELYKKINFFPYDDILENLFEINIHVDKRTNIATLIDFLQSIPRTTKFNIIGNIANVDNYYNLLSFLDRKSSVKYILCSYTNVIDLQPDFNNNFSYTISVGFPLDKQAWKYSRQLLINQALPFEYVFDVSSTNEYQQAEQLINQFKIEKYRFNPIYTGNNIQFFEENVYLIKEDILATPISIKDIFAHQSMNIYEYGKINIMPEGDVHANINNPALGNIHTHSILKIIYKEMGEGKSWFRLRNQSPCNDCVYQWLCPSPSDYELAIGRPNLCHIKD
jgi:pseudo-rSAM protein